MLRNLGYAWAMILWQFAGFVMAAACIAAVIAAAASLYWLLVIATS